MKRPKSEDPINSPRILPQSQAGGFRPHPISPHPNGPIDMQWLSRQPAHVQRQILAAMQSGAPIVTPPPPPQNIRMEQQQVHLYQVHQQGNIPQQLAYQAPPLNLASPVDFLFDGLMNTKGQHHSHAALTAEEELRSIICGDEVNGGDRKVFIEDPSAFLLDLDEKAPIGQGAGSEGPGTGSSQSSSPPLTLREIMQLGDHGGGKAVTCSFSADGLLLASGGHDRKVRLWRILADDSEDPQVIPLGILPLEHAASITQVRFSPVGAIRFLATCSFDKTVHVWNLGRDGLLLQGTESLPTRPCAIFAEHQAAVFSVDFLPTTPDGVTAADTICSCDSDGVLMTWKFGEAEEPSQNQVFQLATQDTAAVTVRQIKFQPWTSHERVPLLAIANGTQVDLFDCRAYRIVGTIRTDHTKPVVSLCWGDTQLPNLLGLATSDALSIWNVMTWASSTSTAIPPQQTPRLQAAPEFRCMSTIPLQGDKIICCTFMRSTIPEQGSEAGKRRVIEKYLVFGTYRLIYLTRLHVVVDAATGLVLQVCTNGQATSADEHTMRPSRHSVMLSCEAHAGMVAGISVTRQGPLLLASAGHDSAVKLWKPGSSNNNNISNGLVKTENPSPQISPATVQPPPDFQSHHLEHFQQQLGDDHLPYLGGD